MKTIPLTKGYVVLVDDADYDRVVAAGPWHALPSHNVVYVAHSVVHKDGRRTTVMLHRFIMGVTDSHIKLDHEDHDGLNNQRYNLRVAIDPSSRWGF